MCYGLLFFAPRSSSSCAERGLHQRMLHVRTAGAARNLLTLAAAGSMQVMMLHLVHPPPAARPADPAPPRPADAVAVTMTVLMLTADTENIQNVRPAVRDVHPDRDLPTGPTDLPGAGRDHLITPVGPVLAARAVDVAAVLWTMAAGGLVLAVHTRTSRPAHSGLVGQPDPRDESWSRPACGARRRADRRRELSAVGPVCAGARGATASVPVVRRSATVAGAVRGRTRDQAVPGRARPAAAPVDEDIRLYRRVIGSATPSAAAGVREPPRSWPFRSTPAAPG